MRVLVVLLLVLAASRAEAETILVAGDSIAFVLAPALQAARPGDVIVNAGQPGDTSDNLTRFIARFDAAAPVDDVVLEIGTNDATEVDPPLTPAETVRNIRRMARYARARGARVLALTPPPSVCKFPPCNAAASRRGEHVYLVSRLLVGLRLPPRMTVVDTRDRWHTVSGGWWNQSDVYGLHPNAAGAALLAAWVSDALDAR